MKKRYVVAGLVAGVLALGVALPGCAPSKEANDQANVADATQGSHDVTLHRGYGTGHGDRGFAQVVVAVGEDGTILATSIDEYEYLDVTMEGVVPVPNSDASFGQNYAEGKVLGSKTANNVPYSANMKAKKQSTQEWLTSITAIEQATVGKEPADLKNAGIDAVSSATLVDTPNYLALVAATAENDSVISEGTYEGDGSNLKLGSVLEGAHGDKCFTSAVTLVQGDTIVATSIDDFQYMAATTAGIVPVPNTEGAFGAGAVTGQVLVSKSVNSPIYSKTMKEKGGATQDWLTSMDAIEASLAGTSVNAKPASSSDAVSGATLVDTANYVKAALDAAKAA